MIQKRLLQLETKLFESLSNAKKLYSSKIPQDVFDQLVSIDPTKTFKYIEKICKFYLQNPDLSIQELKTEIETFDSLVTKNLIDVKDVNQFKSYQEFKSFVFENSDRMSKTAERELVKNKGTEVIINNSNLLVLLIKDKEASIQYGSGTKWCISAKDSQNYFKSYRSKEVTFYFVFQKNLPSSNPNYKIAVAVYNSGEKEVYNAKDKKIKFSVVLRLGVSESIFQVIKLSKYERVGNYVIGEYEVTKEGIINVQGDVLILSKEPISSILDIGQFGKVSGSFNCQGQKLTSLKGSPYSVGKDFNCSYNRLETLEYSPEFVGGKFDCSNNQLLTLEGSPVLIDGSFVCSSNKLVSLKGGPRRVVDRFDCSFNNLESLIGGPKEVGSHYYASFNKLSDLRGSPKIILRDFGVNSNGLKSLLGSPVQVDQDFIVHTNKLMSLEYSPEYVGGLFSCYENNITSIEGISLKLRSLDIRYNPVHVTEEDLRKVCDFRGVLFSN